MNPSTYFTHSRSFPPVVNYPQHDDYPNSYCNRPSVSWDNSDWGYNSGPPCLGSNPEHFDSQFYPSQSCIDYRSSSFHEQPNAIYNQEGYTDPYPSSDFTAFRSSPSFEQSEMTYYQDGYNESQFVNSSTLMSNPPNPEPTHLVQVNQVQDKVLANLRNIIQSLEVQPIPCIERLEPLIEMIDDLNKSLLDWLQDVKDKNPGEFLLGKLAKLRMRFVVALIQSWNNSQDELSSGKPMTEPAQAPVGGDTCYEADQIELKQPIKDDLISSPEIPEPGYEKTYVSLERKVTNDFGTYIDTDPDGEDSSCEVSHEFSDHDFCETIGPEESDRSFDSPITEETDLIRAHITDPESHFLEESVQCPDYQLHPVELIDDSNSEIIRPKSILILPHHLDLEISDGVMNIQEVMEFDMPNEEDRSWEILIWEVNFGGNGRLSRRVPFKLKPSNQNPYDICFEDVKLKHTFNDYPFELQFSVTRHFGLGLHPHKSQARPRLHSDFRFWVIFIQNLRYSRLWGVGLHHNLVHICGPLLTGQRILLFILILTCTCEFFISFLCIVCLAEGTKLSTYTVLFHFHLGADPISTQFRCFLRFSTLFYVFLIQ